MVSTAWRQSGRLSKLTQKGRIVAIEGEIRVEAGLLLTLTASRKGSSGELGLVDGAIDLAHLGEGREAERRGSCPGDARERRAGRRRRGRLSSRRSCRGSSVDSGDRCQAFAVRWAARRAASRDPRRTRSLAASRARSSAPLARGSSRCAACRRAVEGVRQDLAFELEVGVDPPRDTLEGRERLAVEQRLPRPARGSSRALTESSISRVPRSVKRTITPRRSTRIRIAAQIAERLEVLGGRADRLAAHAMELGQAMQPDAGGADQGQDLAVGELEPGVAALAGGAHQGLLDLGREDREHRRARRARRPLARRRPCRFAAA